MREKKTTKNENPTELQKANVKAEGHKRNKKYDF